MSNFGIIIGMALVTFLIRYPVLAIFSRVQLPDVVVRALRYVPVAVLTAIIVPEMVLREGTLDLSLDNAYFIGGIAAVLIAWRTKQLLPTIGLGLLFFFGWRLLTG